MIHNQPDSATGDDGVAYVFAMLLRLLLPVALAAAALAEQSTSPTELARRSLQLLSGSEQKLRDYSFTRRTERKEFSADGTVKSQQSWVARRTREQGVSVTRLVERNGKPLPEDERSRLEETVKKRIAEYQAMSPAERERTSRHNDRDEFLQEFPDAMDCKQLADETVAGRANYVLDCWPKAGYQAKNMRTRLFEKLHGKLWIDKADNELARADAEMFDTVSIGFGVLGRVEKGTHFTLQRRRVAPGAWFAESETMRYAARVMLVRSLNSEVTTRYEDYRPQTDAATASAP